jgi:hypothetical protein
LRTSTSRRPLVVTLRSTICSPVGVTPGGRVRFSPVGSAPVARPLACGRTLVATTRRLPGERSCHRVAGPANRNLDRPRPQQAGGGARRAPRKPGGPARSGTFPTEVGGDPLVRRGRRPVWTPRRHGNPTRTPCPIPPEPSGVVVTVWVSPPADSNRRNVLSTGRAVRPLWRNVPEDFC